MISVTLFKITDEAIHSDITETFTKVLDLLTKIDENMLQFWRYMLIVTILLDDLCTHYCM